jgi:hypothetical protein
VLWHWVTVHEVLPVFTSRLDVSPLWSTSFSPQFIILSVDKFHFSRFPNLEELVVSFNTWTAKSDSYSQCSVSEPQRRSVFNQSSQIIEQDSNNENTYRFENTLYKNTDFLIETTCASPFNVYRFWKFVGKERFFFKFLTQSVRQWWLWGVSLCVSRALALSF